MEVRSREYNIPCFKKIPEGSRSYLSSMDFLTFQETSGKELNQSEENILTRVLKDQRTLV